MSHPIHSHDSDVACRWLCLSAGRRTAQDERELAKALEALPFSKGPIPAQQLPNVEEMLRRVN